MTKQEITAWMKSHKCVDSDIDLDSCGNEEGDWIYAEGDKLFAVHVMNGHPTEQWGCGGYNRGVYNEPEEVVRKTRMVEQTYYEPVTDLI